MTDRTNYLTVVLEKEMRDDDVEPIIDAIRCIRGVSSVGINVVDAMEYMTITRARNELSSKLWDVLK